MTILKLALLGRFQASFGDKPLPSFRTSKVQALLIYLVVEAAAFTGKRSTSPINHRREALMELLWPNLGLKSARDNLRQTLYQLRKAIPAQQHGSSKSISFLESSKLTIGINPDYHFQVDVERFSENLSLGKFAEAASLYHGDFLEDFYLVDSGDFEDWARTRRSSYRRQVLDALNRLTVESLDNGNYDHALGFAQKQIAIDDLQEHAYRQTMEAQALLGQRVSALAQYDRCRQKLMEELGVAPSLETEELLQKIQRDEIRPAEREESPAILPFALDQPDGDRFKEIPLFVGRENELKHLANEFAAAYAGNGCTRFLIGGAGRGKTTLVTQFTRLMVAGYPDVLILSGHCRGPVGAGEPYLPIRQILAQLTGERSSPALLSSEQALRLREAMAITIPAIIHHGADLVDTLVNGGELRHRAAMIGNSQMNWFRQLNAWLDEVEREKPLKDQLFSQVTATLKLVAKERPLLLIIEDLHWTDAATAGLLRHLTFELAGSQILLIGTYRPEEISGQEDHPLAEMQGEWKRRFGDIWLDLSQKDEQEGRAFIDAYLDAETNDLGRAFRNDLFAHTRGHALFTVELLRAMQERGDLYQDEEGAWQEGKTIDWHALPARVEGVIEQRFGRLDLDLQEVLSIATVEGESFTAEIIAEIQGLDPRTLVRRLSREVEGQHRLIQAESMQWQHGRPLARYRFRHQLFQQHLYQALPELERAYIHEAVGRQLEMLAEDGVSQAAALAWHFDQAGNSVKALPYLLQAGDEARSFYASQEAVSHYERALTILKEKGDIDKAGRVLLKLGLVYMNAFDFQAAQEAYNQSFALNRQVSQYADQVEPFPAPHPLRLIAEPQPPLGHLLFAAIEDLGFLPGLVQLTADFAVVPHLAESWEILNQGRTYRFHLRRDAIWSDGQPVVAEDFIFAWQQRLDPQTGAENAKTLYDILAAADYHQGREPDRKKLGFKALDDHTLQIELIRPTAYFLQILTQVIASALPRHVIERYGERWADPGIMVSCGPYLLQTNDKETMVLRRNHKYFGHYSGNVERIEFTYCSLRKVGLKDYRADRVDLQTIWPLSPREFQHAAQEYANEFKVVPMLQTNNIRFNVAIPPFDDVRVRRAFAYAFDSHRLAQDYGAGRDFPATGGFVPPGIPGHVPGIALPYDPDKAQRLLAEARYPDGKNMPALEAFLWPWDAARQIKNVLLPWQDILGVKIKWQEIPWSLYVEEVQKIRPHIAQSGWQAIYPDPDYFLRVGMQFLSKWRHEDYERLIEEARTLLENDLRLKLFRQAEKILVHEVPILPQLYSNQYFLVKPWIKNHQSARMNNFSWHKIIIEPH